MLIYNILPYKYPKMQFFFIFFGDKMINSRGCNPAHPTRFKRLRFGMVIVYKGELK